MPPVREPTRKQSGTGRKETLIGIAVQKNHLWSSPVVFPFFRTYDVLRQSSAACKALKVLERGVLKKLHSTRCEGTPAGVWPTASNSGALQSFRMTCLALGFSATVKSLR